MEDIKNAVQVAVKRVFDIETEVDVVVAPEGAEADYATNAALKLAKRVEKNPMETALGIVSKLEVPGFEVAVAAPGFINFISRDEYLAEKMRDLAGDFDKIISRDEYSGKTVVCEFSDPNPFKVLHVGHLYTSIMGEAISRLIENAGGEVHRANFGGDVGLHVAKTIWALRKAQTLQETSSSTGTCRKPKLQQTTSNRKELNARSNTPLSARSRPLGQAYGLERGITPNILASAYVSGTRAYEEDEKAKQEIVELNKEIYDIALNDKHDSEVAEIYWKGREISYAYFEDFYAKIGVKFEKYYPESTVAGRGLAKVKEGAEKGVYEESEGALVYRGEKVGLHTRVFVNAAGLPTYEAKDVGLIYSKWDDYHFDESVVITGNDIIEYMKVVLASIREMSPELAERTTHITHGNVRLPGNEKMSSRKGNFLKAVDVIEMVRKALAESYEAADEKVVMAAVKYAFLKYKIGGNIVFDVKESVSMTGNSGPYLLYSAVRAKKILDKVGRGGATDSSVERVTLSSSKDSDPRQPGNALQKNCCAPEETSNESGLNLITTSEEVSCRALAKKLLQYEEVLKEATEAKAPHVLCNYLFEVAQEFSRFYEKVKVAGSEQEAERAQLVQIFVQVMEHGLSLLGIEVPEEM